jgi:alkylated DNA repair dioxygenase AlkB
METVISTTGSALNLYDLDKNIYDLIPIIIDEIHGSLVINPEIKIFGKIAKQRRSVGFFSDESVGYKYSGKIMPAQILTECLKYLLEYINTKFCATFNGILVNYYIDGNEYIGKHSDDEKNVDEIGVIAISSGAIRKFRIRDKNTNKIIKDIPTDPSKIIQMIGDFQKEFTHEIPVEKKVKDGRYSFTFRKHLDT